MANQDETDSETDLSVTRRTLLNGAGGIVLGGITASASVTAQSDATNVLTIQGLGEPANYRFSVSGKLRPNPSEGRLESWDSIDGNTATGWITGTHQADSFRFSGEIESFTFRQNEATVLLNGTEVDPTSESSAPASLSVEWTTKFEERVSPQSVAPSADGYLSVGTYSEDDPANPRTRLIEVDADGEPLRQDAFEYVASPSTIIRTADGGHLVCGTKDWTVDESGRERSVETPSRLMKFDSAGDVQWRQEYAGRNTLGAVETADDGYVVVGQEWRRFGRLCPLVRKVDGDGTEEWSESYEMNGYDAAFSVTEASDEGYVLATGTLSAGVETSTAGLVKVDESGQKEWSRTYEDRDWGRAETVVTAPDGGYVFVGEIGQISANPETEDRIDLWLVRTDESGEKVWERTYETANLERAEGLASVGDDRYVAAGRYGTVVLVDSDGTQLDRFELSDADYLNEITSGSDGRVAATGGISAQSPEGWIALLQTS